MLTLAFHSRYLLVRGSSDQRLLRLNNLSRPMPSLASRICQRTDSNARESITITTTTSVRLSLEHRTLHAKRPRRQKET
jgi:hypothetical protein